MADDTSIREVTALALKRAGFRVTTSVDGARCWPAPAQAGAVEVFSVSPENGSDTFLARIPVTLGKRFVPLPACSAPLVAQVVSFCHTGLRAWVD